MAQSPAHVTGSNATTHKTVPKQSAFCQLVASNLWVTYLKGAGQPAMSVEYRVE